MAASAADWLARSAWTLRSPEFARLVSDAGTIGMELGGVHDELWRRWVGLSRYPTIIEAHRIGRLRYAAIDWTRQPVTLGDAQSHSVIAARGIELAQTFEWLLQSVPVDHAAWFANPIVNYDLEGELRLAFVTRGDTAPPESLLDFPRCDERGFVYVVGASMRRMVDGPIVRPISTIIDRCTADGPELRFSTLDALVEELRHLGAPARRRAHLRNPRRHWTYVERGLGLLAAGSNSAASVCFADAMKVAKGFDLAHELSIHARSLPATPTTAAGEIPHRDVIVVPAQAIVDVQILRHATPPELPNPRTRRVYAIANGAVASSVIGIHQPAATEEAPLAPLLRTRRYREALAACDAVLVEHPEDAPHHHLRGKSLLGLGRLADARAAFERACTLEPKMLEAMLLRREVDRAILVTRASAGTAQAMTMALPPHLAELRDVLVASRVVDAIQLLRRPEYDDDTVAQMLLAELLCSDDRASDALEIYARIATPPARVARARALITLDRAAEALDELIGLDDEALEVRARALLALGRDDEAETQLAEYLRIVAQRSERRVRSL